MIQNTKIKKKIQKAPRQSLLSFFSFRSYLNKNLNSSNLQGTYLSLICCPLHFLCFQHLCNLSFSILPILFRFEHRNWIQFNSPKLVKFFKNTSNITPNQQITQTLYVGTTIHFSLLFSKFCNHQTLM